MQHKSRFPLILILALIFIAGISIPVLGSKVYRVQPGDTAYQIARWQVTNWRTRDTSSPGRYFSSLILRL